MVLKSALSITFNFILILYHIWYMYVSQIAAQFGICMGMADRYNYAE